MITQSNSLFDWWLAESKASLSSEGSRTVIFIVFSTDIKAVPPQGSQ
jgi:hypothetical protein